MSTSKSKLTLQDVLNGANWNNLKFGCRRGHVPSLMRGGAFYASDFAVIEHYPQVHTAPDAQELGSCTCNGFTGRVECAIFETHGIVVQLDYDRLYQHVRQDIYGSMADNGAQLRDPFDVARDRGLIPPTSRMRQVSLTAKAICNELRRGPFMVGVSVHEGWAPDALHPVNGAVDESMDIDLQEGTNGHCMLFVATSLHNGVPGMVHRQSWGPIGINGKGLVFETLTHFFKWAIDLPVAVDLGPDWQTFRGWEQWVVK